MNLVEELKNYFETTSEETILEDWKSCETYDSIGPTVDEFLEVQKQNELKTK